MNYNSIIYKILRYLAQGLAIYLIFRFMPELTTGDPNTRLNNSDILMITVIIMLIYILFENLCNLYTDDKSTNIDTMTQLERSNLCSSVCSINHEPMTNVNQNIDPNPNYNSNTFKTTYHDIVGNNNNGNNGTKDENGINKGNDNNQNGGKQYITLPINKQPINKQNIINELNQVCSRLSQVNNESNQNDQVPTLPIVPEHRSETENNYKPEMGESSQELNLNENDRRDIALLNLINNRPHGSQFYNYLQKLKHNGRNGNNDRSNQNNQSGLIKANYNESTISKPPKNINCQIDGGRQDDDLIDNDMPYTDYNHLPMAVGHDSRDYEYGYSFLPPSQWYPQPPFPPVCVTEKQSPVCPVYTMGTPVDVKEWDDSRKIMPPDRINIDYAKKLNGGR